MAPWPLPRQTLNYHSPSTGHHQVDSHFVGHQDPQEFLVHSRLKTGGGSINCYVFVGGRGVKHSFPQSLPVHLFSQTFRALISPTH